MAVPSEPARTGSCDRLARERFPVCIRSQLVFSKIGIFGSRSSRLLFFFLSQGPVEGFPRHCPAPSHASSDERIGAAIGQRRRLLGKSGDLPCRITRGDSPSRWPSIWQPLQKISGGDFPSASQHAYLRRQGGSTLAWSRFRDRTDAESNEGSMCCPRELSLLGIFGLSENKVLRSSYRPVLTLNRVLDLSMITDPLFASLTWLPP